MLIPTKFLFIKSVYEYYLSDFCEITFYVLSLP